MAEPDRTSVIRTLMAVTAFPADEEDVASCAEMFDALRRGADSLFAVEAARLVDPAQIVRLAPVQRGASRGEQASTST